MAKVSHRPGLCRPKADQGSRPWGPRPAGQGLHGPGSSGGPSALDLWGRGQVLALHWAPVPLPTAGGRALCTPRAREDCGRKPLIHCGVPSQPCRCGPAGWGKWPMEAAPLASVTHRAGRQQPGPWQRPRKPLISPSLTIIRPAQKSRHSGRCGFFPAAERRRRARGGCAAAEGPSRAIVSYL